MEDCSLNSLAAVHTAALVMDPANVWTTYHRDYGGALPIDRLLAPFGNLRAGGRIAIACLARRPGDTSAMADSLKGAGFQVRERLVNLDDQGALGKTNCDAEIGFALAEAGATADSIVLFSGDGDFAESVRRLRVGGKRMYVAAFESSVSRSLRGAASGFISLDRLLSGSRAESTKKPALDAQMERAAKRYTGDAHIHRGGYPCGPFSRARTVAAR